MKRWAIAGMVAAAFVLVIVVTALSTRGCENSAAYIGSVVKLFGC